MIYSSTFTLSFFCFVGGIDSSFIIQPRAFQTVQLGENVTIECYLPKTDFNTMVWYKQEIGKMPVPIARCYNYLKEITFLDGFKYKRLSILADQGIFHLTISATENEDTAMYFCGVVILNELRFGTGTFLMIKGVQFHMQTVLQKPTVALIYPGDNVTLECTIEIGDPECSEPHRVYWFRYGDSGDSHPGVIYTHGDSSDQCKKSSDSGSPTQSCVYELPKKNLSSSDAGAYYCAISTCGVILFGNGTKLNIIDNNSTFSPIVVALVTTNIISVLLIIITIACRCKEQNHSPGSPNYKTSLDTHVACDEALNYAALSLTKPLSSRGSRRQQMFKDTMVYSQVKYENSAGDTIKLK